MKIEIVKCNKPTSWYSDKIGNIYNVKKRDGDESSYVVTDVIDKSQGHRFYMIRVSDCRVLNL